MTSVVLLYSSHGCRIPTESTDNYRIFTGKYIKLEDSKFLDIYKDKDLEEYPGLHLDDKLSSGKVVNPIISLTVIK